ncbi:primosomal protein N' (replication factor Y) - superfamily II helicase [Roseibacterium sp. SDUM158017]|uniref:primosomal protein N' (replication factor Y) - superfamily II helicase n=1 Tax=Roseicyclus salinarum TaxID=3036773 RepID=UPI002415467D|nr:primosomal protein N' (replication factor Y) - superfamily II helicase [Roseibacterium sp. SDUM158017]MDG4648102.1 primosomal protein N' (replication factor Y) - superfamily II helicase [Roseibacterium sp. SDUM158017]
MRFAPAEGRLVCDHCGNVEEITDDAPEAGPWGEAPGGIRELDFRSALRDRLDASEMEETRVTQCPSCGAQVTLAADVHAKECPFCATPVVTDTGTHRHVKPQGLIPFQLTEKQAHDAMNDWLGRLWFAPNGLQDYARKGRKMDGIYVPFWTYDADTRTGYSGQRGTAYHVTVRGADGKTRTVRRIRWRHVTGRVSRFFDDVLVLASRSLPKGFTDGLAPWSLEALQEYRPDYLSGFRAEGYTVDLDEGMQEARAIMDAQIRQDIRRDIGGDAQRIGVYDTDISGVTFKHILLPVWVAAYRYRGEPYRFVVNGQTGKVRGERPWSAIKIAIAVILAIILGAAVFYGLQIADEGGLDFGGLQGGGPPGLPLPEGK